TDTVGFIRKLPHQLVESFKSTLDEVREADLLLHIVDVSHAEFEEQYDIVQKTLSEIGAGDKPVFVVFNKIDAFTYTAKDEDDLTPMRRENYSLEMLKTTWMSKIDKPSIFISAKNKTNTDLLRSDMYKMVYELHCGRYPFNNFLY
ncbi:MAG: GTPase, partial [Rikenellaceae bacterium]